MTIEELISKLEAATEGTVMLDSAIAAQLGFNGWTPKEWDEVAADPELFGPSIPGAPAYTNSLDASLMLVPAGFVWTVATYWCEGEDRPPYFADCADGRIKEGHTVDIQQGWAPTAPLALCIAALRARLSATTSQ
jgi:hypothetical protein